MSSLQKRIPYRNKKLLDAAKGEDCTLNSPWCNYDSDTSVFCHLNESYAGKGIGQKADDFGFIGCSSCHDAYDRRIPVTDDWRNNEDKFILRAVYRTFRVMVDKGIKY